MRELNRDLDRYNSLANLGAACGGCGEFVVRKRGDMCGQCKAADPVPDLKHFRVRTLQTQARATTGPWAYEVHDDSGCLFSEDGFYDEAEAETAGTKAVLRHIEHTEEPCQASNAARSATGPARKGPVSRSASLAGRRHRRRANR